MTMPLRHQPTDECNGQPRPTLILGPSARPFSAATCVECGQTLCPCEEVYGHDCEA